MEPNSAVNFELHNWVHFHSKENKEAKSEYDEEEDLLSLCELATKEPNESETNHPEQQCSHEEDFDFAWGGRNLMENKMCSADELFFQGKILSSGLMSKVTQPREFTCPISFLRSEPVSVDSSRSSSSRSQNSGTSGSSSMSESEFTGYKPTNRNQNKFHPHPSPSPQIQTRSSHHCSLKTSSKWSILQLGPLKQREIGVLDLKNRSQRSMKDQNQNEKKKHILLFGGCKCNADVIETSTIVSSSMLKPTRHLNAKGK